MLNIIHVEPSPTSFVTADGSANRIKGFVLDGGSGGLLTAQTRFLFL